MPVILVAEDEKPLLQALKTVFEKEDFSVLEASNGEMALELALQEKPDFILLDIMMPKMTGLEALKKLKEDPWGKDASIMLLTNIADSNKVAEATTLGVFDYMIKSDWNIKDIVEKVKERMSNG